MENPGAYILLDAPTDLNETRISEAFAARYPDVPVVVGATRLASCSIFQGS